MKQITLDAATGSPLETSHLKLETVASINSLHASATAWAGQARDLAERAAHTAILIGLRLRAIKAETPHGEWGKLFGAEGFDFTERTAHRYMQAAEQVMAQRLTGKKARAVESLALKDSLDESDRALLNEATHGQTYRQLLLDLEIIRPTQDEALQRGRNNLGGPRKGPKVPDSDLVRRQRCDDAIREAMRAVKDIIDDEADLDATPDLRRVFVMEIQSAAEILRVRMRGAA